MDTKGASITQIVLWRSAISPNNCAIVHDVDADLIDLYGFKYRCTTTKDRRIVSYGLYGHPMALAHLYYMSSLRKRVQR